MNACSAMLIILLTIVATAQANEVKEDGGVEPESAHEEIFPLPQIAVKTKKIEAPPTIIIREVSTADFNAWNAHTAGDALTFVPGVNVQIGGTSGDARAWVRGFRDRDVLVLFDGIPIASGFEGTIDLNEISLQAVSGIRVLKSAPSVIYGTNGMGGVIDVIPQSGVTGRFLSGQAELGSDQRRLLRAAASGGIGDISYAVSASHQQADDFSLSDDYQPELNQPAGERVNSDFKRNSLFLQFESLQSFMGHTSLFFNFSDAKKGLPVEAGVDDPDYERLTKSRRQTFGFSNHFQTVPLSLKLYYNSYDSELSIYTDSSFEAVDELEVAEDYSWGGKLYSTIETSSNNSLALTAGAQTDVYKAEGELEEGNKAELTTWTLAAEDQYWISKRLSVAAGLIYTYFDQTRLDRSSSALNPQLALAWQATDALSLHASAAQRTRFPKLRELYRRRYGNPDLTEQTANNYELGLKYQHGGELSSDFSLFRSDVDDLIERPDRRSLYQNLDRVTFRGLEMATGGWVGERVFARLAYTYVDAAEKFAGGGSRQLRSRPKHTAMLEFRYRFGGDFLLSFNGIYVADLYDLDPDNVYTKLPSYFIADVKLLKSFTQKAEVYLAASNLFDEDSMQRLGNPREGRALMLGLDLNF